MQGTRQRTLHHRCPTAGDSPRLADCRPTTTNRKLQPVTHKHTLILWDIDNTLLYTGGAGSLGMARAFHDLYGVPDAFRRVEFSGRTDTAIFRDAAIEHGIDEDRIDEEIARFCDAYVPQLDAALHEVDGGRLMPGIRDILESLRARDDVAQALGTGNFRRGGELKLRHFEIDAFFPGTPGGFGEDSHDRHEVIRIAIDRMSNGARPERVVVIGDTPHDVTAAKANDAFALAVATGRNSTEELRAAGADAALEDLTDVAAALRLILGD
jgi:phosphoglycolate phosphatase